MLQCNTVLLCAIHCSIKNKTEHYRYLFFADLPVDVVFKPLLDTSQGDVSEIFGDILSETEYEEEREQETIESFEMNESPLGQVSLRLMFEHNHHTPKHLEPSRHSWFVYDRLWVSESFQWPKWPPTYQHCKRVSI